MQNETVARRYSTAIFELATESGKVDAVGAGLRAVLTSLEKDEEARRFFASPVVDRDVKAKAFATVLDGRVDEIARNTVLLLIRKRRTALLPAIVREYDAMALNAAGLERIEIVSARPLSDAEAGDVVARLARTYGKTFEATRRVDPALLGGFRVMMGDVSIDGSLAGRIDDLAHDLITAGPQIAIVKDS